MSPLSVLRRMFFTTCLLLGAETAIATKPVPDSEPVEQPRTITIAYTSFKPYIYHLGDQTLGVQALVLQHILETRMGHKVRFVQMPWKRVQYLVAKGDVDAFIATRNQERDEFAVASKLPIATWWVGAFVRKDWLEKNKVEIKSVKDLKPFRIGSLHGNGWVEKNMQGYDIQWANEMEQLIPMLLKGRVDVIPESPLVMPFYGSVPDLYHHIAFLELQETAAGMYLYVSKKSSWSKVLKQFDEELKEARINAELDKFFLDVNTRPL